MDIATAKLQMYERLLVKKLSLPLDAGTRILALPMDLDGREVSILKGRLDSE